MTRASETRAWAHNAGPRTGLMYSLSALGGSKVDDTLRRGATPASRGTYASESHSSQTAAVAGLAVEEAARPDGAGIAQHGTAAPSQVLAGPWLQHAPLM